MYPEMSAFVVTMEFVEPHDLPIQKIVVRAYSQSHALNEFVRNSTLPEVTADFVVTVTKAKA